MELKSRNYVYPYAPDYMDNRKQPKGKMMVIGLKSVTMPENDAFQREVAMIRNDYAIDKAQELIEKKGRGLIESKCAFFENVIIDGVEITDFATFYAEAPIEIVKAVSTAVFSTELLTLGERKNFLPESGTASGFPAKATKGTSAAAVKKKIGSRGTAGTAKG